LQGLYCFSQKNLVPNYSFEQYINCPSSANLAPPPPWYEPTNKGSGYANACSADPLTSVPNNFLGGGAYQYPKTGNGYLALFYVNGYLSNQRNYVQVKLIDSLKKDRYYSCECYVNRTEGTQYGCNNVAMLLTKTAVKVDIANFPYGVLPANPQIVNYGNPVIADTMNWVKVSGIFKAQGGEQYLTLGNFKYDTQTIFKAFQPSGYYGATYLIDDVSVIPLDSFCLKADAGKDTAITLGDSVFIGSLTNGIDSLKWQIQNTNIMIDSTRPGFWVHPLVTTSYVLQQVVNGCFSADTVVVTVGTVPLKFTAYRLQLTENVGQFTSNGGVRGGFVENIWQTANEVNVSHFNIQRSVKGKDFISIGRLVANNKSYNEYRYTDDRLQLTENGGLLSIYYRIESVDFDGRKQYSEVRQLTIDNKQSAIKIFPNPAKDFVTISSNQNIKSLQLTNLYGQVIQEYSSINSNSYQIKISTLASGVYWLKTLLKDGTHQTQKLLIEHKN
jgi:hypothetical protein